MIILVIFFWRTSFMRGLGGKRQQTLFLNKYKVSGMVSCVAPRTQLSSQQTEQSSTRYKVYMEIKGVSIEMLVMEGDQYRT